MEDVEVKLVEVEQDKSKQMYEESIQILGEVYERGFDGLGVTQETLVKLQRLQHNILCNAMWHYEGPEEFDMDVFAHRLRMATQAMFLLGVFFEQDRKE